MSAHQVSNITPLTNDEQLISFICQDLEIEIRQVEPLYWQLHKLGCESMKVMTLSLTTQVKGKWLMGNSIDQVYNQIINNFK